MSDFWPELDRARAAVMGPDADPAAAARIIATLWAAVDAGPAQQKQARRGILLRFAQTYQLEPPLLAAAPPAPPVPGGTPLTGYVRDTKPGISLVTASRNRTENLLRALPSWLARREISQIVIVDWGSDEPVSDSLDAAGVSDPRIVVARVDQAHRWILSYAFNAGFRLAAHQNILKVDADIVLSDRFFRDNRLQPNSFIAGNWRTAPKGQEFVNGFFYLPRSTLMQVQGFNEYITTYGWDDDDIYARLIAAGATRVDVAPGTVQHLDHDDSARLETAASDTRRTGWDDLHALTMFKIRTNRFVATIMPDWNADRTMLPFMVQPQTPGRLRLVQAGPVPHDTPPHIFRTAQQMAAYELLSWRAGLAAYELTPAALDDLLTRHRLAEISETLVATTLAQATPDTGTPGAPALTRRTEGRIFVDAQHGLGNRLRAIGSAAAIAQATARELVIVWQPDHHCDAPFEALFTPPCAVIDTSFTDQARADGLSVLNYMEIEQDSAKGAPLVLTPGVDAYVRSAYVIAHPASHWDSENALLHRLHPVQAVQDLIHSVPVHRDIGLHIRMEGASGTALQSYDDPENWTADSHAEITAWRDKSHYSAFMARLDALLAAQPDARVFLAADLPQTYTAFAQTYGDRVVGLRRQLFDRSAAQLQYALADVLLLARCKTLLGSNWSSFTEAALRLSSTIRQHERSGVDF